MFINHLQTLALQEQQEGARAGSKSTRVRATGAVRFPGSGPHGCGRVNRSGNVKVQKCELEYKSGVCCRARGCVLEYIATCVHANVDDERAAQIQIPAKHGKGYDQGRVEVSGIASRAFQANAGLGICLQLGVLEMG